MVIKVLSFNCADSPVNFGNREVKFKLISEEIKKLKVDVVFFQELVTKKAVKTLVENLKDYSFAGSTEDPKKSGGLLIASKFKILNSEFIKYNRQAYWNPLSLSDWVLGKGYLMVQLKVGKSEIKVVTSHTVCNYFRDCFGKKALRDQLMQLAEFSKNYKGKLIVSGDFNLIFGSELYHELIKESRLFDPSSKAKFFTMNPDAVAKPWNYFSELIYGKVKLDYTLFNGFNNKKIKQKPVLNKKVKTSQGKEMWLSDHFGLFTEVKI